MASDPVVLFSNCEILGSTYRESLLSLKLANCKYAPPIAGAFTDCFSEGPFAGSTVAEQNINMLVSRNKNLNLNFMIE